MKNLKINKKILFSKNLQNYEILKILYVKYIVINYFWSNLLYLNNK